MALKIDAEKGKDSDSYGLLTGSMRKNIRYGKYHAFKIVLFVFAVFAVITLIKPSFGGRNALRFLSSKKQPLVVVITPTYRRSTRLPDMTRFGNTLMHVKDLHWIVVEDAESTYDYVERLLNRTGIPYTYLAIKTLAGYPKRGWYQRTVAMNYLRQNKKQIMGDHTEGVLYFGDDDNSYDLRLFNDYIRNVKKVGLWAVGMVGGTAVESPDVVNGSVVGFKVYWNPARKFAVDMAGFAVNLRVVFNSTAVFGTSCGRGGGAPETCLLEDMGLGREDIEPFGYDKERDRDLCVWHTKTMSAAYDLSKTELNGYIYEGKIPDNATLIEEAKKAEEAAKLVREEAEKNKKEEEEESAEKKTGSDGVAHADDAR